MKKITLAVATSLAATGLYAQNSLTVNISNISAPKGNLEIGLFNSEKGFLKDGKQVLKKKVKVTGNTLKYTFSNLPKGEYAIALYHDKNLNNKCDTNFIGMPTEGFGFSNNFRPTVAAPKFSQTKFLLDKSKSVSIKLIN